MSVRDSGDAQELAVVAFDRGVLGLAGDLGLLLRLVDVGERAVELVGVGGELGRGGITRDASGPPGTVRGNTPEPAGPPSPVSPSSRPGSHKQH